MSNPARLVNVRFASAIRDVARASAAGARVHYLWLPHPEPHLSDAPLQQERSEHINGRPEEEAARDRRANQSDRISERVTAMKDETFTELLASANEALEHAQRKRNLRTTTLPLPPKALNGRAVKRVRASLHASQAVFARYLNVSTKLVQAWEADRRTPEGPALVLLHIAARQPDVIENVRRSAGSNRTASARSRSSDRSHAAAE
jgi:putative transcriptional regulator